MLRNCLHIFLKLPVHLMQNIELTLKVSEAPSKVKYLLASWLWHLMSYIKAEVYFTFNRLCYSWLSFFGSWQGIGIWKSLNLSSIFLVCTDTTYIGTTTYHAWLSNLHSLLSFETLLSDSEITTYICRSTYNLAPNSTKSKLMRSFVLRLINPTARHF